MGFGMHPHRDMEIVTHVIDGEVTHHDSLGNSSRIISGEVQRMTAGTGVLHRQFNESRDKTLHLLQIWIFPGQKGLSPEYEQKAFPKSEKDGRLRWIASEDGRNGSITIHQDAEIHSAFLEEDARVAHRFRLGRGGWVQVARGAIQLHGSVLKAGDGAAISDENEIQRVGVSNESDRLLFDLA